VSAALTQAIDFHQRASRFSRQAKLDAAVALGEWGVFSAAQISEMLDIPKWERKAIAPHIRKTDRTGGRLRPEALEPLLRVAQLRANGEIDVFAVKAAIDAGASMRMASRLTGVPETSLKRYYAKADQLTRGGTFA